MRSRGSLILVLVLVLVLAALAPPLLAQQILAPGETRVPRLRLGGVRFESGFASAKDADRGFQIGGSLALGTIFLPWLHLNVGVGHWSADLDRSVHEDSGKGSISDLVVSTDLRWDPVRVSRVRPYLLGGLAGHFAGADIPGDPTLEDARSGFAIGLDIGAGIRTEAPGLGVTFEARRRFTEDIGNWTFLAGLGWTFGGSDSGVRSTGGVPVAGVAQPYAVPAAPPADTAYAENLARVARAMQILVEQNRGMRADIDSLKRVVAREVGPDRDEPATRPVSSTVTSGEPGPGAASTDSRTSFGAAIRRVELVRERPDALVDTGTGYRLLLPGTFAFESGSSKLSVAARGALRQIALVLLRHQDVTLRVDGHADAWGDPEANDRISRERAVAVRDEIVQLGVAPARIDTHGLGSARPIADNRTADGRARNRRVEMTFEVEAG